MTTSNPSTVFSDHDHENLYALYEKCKRKSYYKNGKPRPCRSQRCPCEMCRRKHSEKEAAILLRSFRDQPPDYTFVLKLTDDQPTYDVMMAEYLNNFTQKVRDFRKSDDTTFEYDIRIEFRHGEPHCHVTIISPLGWSKEAVKDLAAGWWASSCPGRAVLVYADKVRNVIGHGNYVTKNLKNRRTVEMPPPEWSGRRCRFVRRSGGFLTKTKAELWREQCDEWYPKRSGPNANQTEGEGEADPTGVEAPTGPPERVRRLSKPGRPSDPTSGLYGPSCAFQKRFLAAAMSAGMAASEGAVRTQRLQVRMGNYGVMSFKEFLAVQEGLLLPDRPPAKGLSRINPFPTSHAHRRRLHAKPVQPSKPFAPTVRRVAEIVPQNLIPKL